MVRSFGLSIADEHFVRHGTQHPLGEGFSGAQDILPQQFDEQTALEHAARVPVSLLKEVLVTGTSDDIVDQVAERRDCGVRYAVLANVSPLQTSLRKGLAASGPFLKALRKLKKL